MIIMYMTYGAELRLTTLLLRLGLQYGRDFVRSPPQPGDVRGTTTITAALTGEGGDDPGGIGIGLSPPPAPRRYRRAGDVRLFARNRVYRGCINEISYLGEKINLRNISRMEAR